MIEQRIYDAQYMCRKYGAFAAYTQCLLLAGLGLAGRLSWGCAGLSGLSDQPGQGQASLGPDQPM